MIVGHTLEGKVIAKQRGVSLVGRSNKYSKKLINA